MKRRILAAALGMAVMGGCNEQRSSEPMMVARPAWDRVHAAAPASPRGLDAGVPRVQQREQPQSIAVLVGLDHDDGGAVDHLGRVAALRQEGELAGAFSEARRAVFDDPQSAAALEEAGKLALQVGEKEMAKMAWTELSRLRPDYAQPMLSLARVQLEEDDAKAALRSTTEALARDAGLAEAHHLRGRAELRLGAMSQAIHDFERAIELEPKHGHAFNNLGYAWLVSNKPEEAVEPLERAAQLLPRAAFVHNNLGIAYEKTGRMEEARAEYARALDLKPSYVKAQLNYARIDQLAQIERTFEELQALDLDEVDQEPAVGAPASAEPEGTVGGEPVVPAGDEDGGEEVDVEEAEVEVGEDLAE